jgi:putative transposase
MKRSYERHLPHRVPEGSPIFLTWNLKGALPGEVIEMLRRERERLERGPTREGESTAERKVRHGKILFGITDGYLDRTDKGPMHLADPASAKLVEDALLFGVSERYDLFAWCVMGNHVHVLLEPRWELKKVTQGIKGYTAHEINARHGQQGRVFWQDESYDHWVRDETEVFQIIDYIENNQVAAGLCTRPEDWSFSSARLRESWPRGQPFPQ